MQMKTKYIFKTFSLLDFFNFYLATADRYETNYDTKYPMLPEDPQSLA